MREDGVDEFLFRGLEIHGDHEALDQLGHLGPHHMGAEKLAGLRVEDRLDQAFGLAERDRLAVADEWEAPDLEGVPGFLGLCFREADGGDLRAAIGAAREFSACPWDGR